MFVAGTRQFPNYLPLYRTRAIHLLPRWLGEEGETLALIEKRAQQIGGDDGEIYYGRAIWHLTQSVGNLKTDFSYPYPRAARGLKLLHERFPDSLSVASTRLDLAFRAKEWRTAQEILSASNGHILDSSWNRWAVPRNQKSSFEQRMLILGTTVE